MHVKCTPSKVLEIYLCSGRCKDYQNEFTSIHEFQAFTKHTCTPVHVHCKGDTEVRYNIHNVFIRNLWNRMQIILVGSSLLTKLMEILPIETHNIHELYEKKISSSCKLFLRTIEHTFVSYTGGIFFWQSRMTRIILPSSSSCTAWLSTPSPSPCRHLFLFINGITYSLALFSGFVLQYIYRCVCKINFFMQQ